MILKNTLLLTIIFILILSGSIVLLQIQPVFAQSEQKDWRGKFEYRLTNTQGAPADIQGKWIHAENGEFSLKVLGDDGMGGNYVSGSGKSTISLQSKSTTGSGDDCSLNGEKTFNFIVNGTMTKYIQILRNTPLTAKYLHLI